MSNQENKPVTVRHKEVAAIAVEPFLQNWWSDEQRASVILHSAQLIANAEPQPTYAGSEEKLSKEQQKVLKIAKAGLTVGEQCASEDVSLHEYEVLCEIIDHPSLRYISGTGARKIEC